MANPYNAKCLVLKKTKLGESDLILSLLSSSGKQIRAVAKAARKPGNKRFGARVEPFSYVSLQLYPGKSLDNITELKLLESHLGCRESFEKTSACTLVTEFLDKYSSDGDVGEKIFQLTNSFFSTVSKTNTDKAIVLTEAYFIKAFTFLGFKPALNKCALCNKEIHNASYFEVSYGGSLCDDCASGIYQLNKKPEIASWLSFLLYSTFDEILVEYNYPLQEIFQIIELWISEHIGVKLKSASLFRSLL